MNLNRPLRPTGADRFGIFCMVLLLLASLAFFARLLLTGLLSDTWLWGVMGALLLINALHVLVQVPIRRGKAGKLLCSAAALALTAAMVYGMTAAGAVQAALYRIAGGHVEKEVICLYVNTDDAARTVEDTAAYRFGWLEGETASDMEELLGGLFGGAQPASGTYPAMTALADALYDDEVGAVLLGEGYAQLLTEYEGYEDFLQRTRVLYTYTATREVGPAAVSAAVTHEPFVVYCSGIDARSGDVSVKSRSDVNILAVVHPGTRRLLLVNTPRDCYLPLARNGRMDKLTHAGLYGIEESMEVLDNLYGIQTAYYVRVNFVGLVKIVDALGGIDVQSEQAFTCIGMEIPDGEEFTYQEFTFRKGSNHLSGAQALAFARERYAFTDGDNQRGRNQMAVIRAIVEKACSAAVLARWQELLEAVSGAFVTNMPYGDIAALVQLQLKDGTAWQTDTCAVMGRNATELSYALGQNCSVIWPDAASVSAIREQIGQVMAGQAPAAS